MQPCGRDALNSWFVPLTPDLGHFGARILITLAPRDMSASLAWRRTDSHEEGSLMLDDFASVVDDRRNDEALRPRLAQHTPATATEDAGSAPCRNMHQHHLLGAAPRPWRSSTHWKVLMTTMKQP